MPPSQQNLSQDPLGSDELSDADAGDSPVGKTPLVAGDPSARLVAAAGPVFARRGFDRAPVREIAKVAGVNIAAVNYYFGDKMGLYRAVLAGIRNRRQREFPAPVVGDDPPEETLRKLVRTLLSRMLASGSTGWESMLMMREVQQPTAALSEVIQEYFRPIHDALCQTIEQLIAPLETSDSEPTRSWQENALVAQVALGIVGQCLHYLLGKQVIEQLVQPEVRAQHYDVESLCRHITASTLATCGRSDIVQVRQRIDRDAGNATGTEDRPVQTSPGPAT
ncbi:CerR family C-terminal domain-containing protein [Rhodopirellula sp. SWK7]|uniref:CerR family C-terminal domain-containing protein n=1 Tax=Rhodopirellula sp. SWK7 TaxID=595460 RepID=UPI0002BE4787|nr:CerR family C-terminal domain-containing protein [Rhodopirellula sp. SWK7]EMI44994.1 transcriptional regulator, TetR family [Rhodopirellula sp. SWK7]